MKQGSLDMIISDMIRRLETLRSGDQAQAAGDIFRDIEIFMAADPVLSALHKDYVDTNRRFRGLAEERGFDDPMTEVAADMLDSTRSAVQTRLIELQESREEEEMRSGLERRLRARRAAEEVAHARFLADQRNKDREGDLFFWFLMLLWFFSRTAVAVRKNLSAANDFALVAASARRFNRHAV